MNENILWGGRPVPTPPHATAAVCAENQTCMVCGKEVPCRTGAHIEFNFTIQAEGNYDSAHIRGDRYLCPEHAPLAMKLKLSVAE